MKNLILILVLFISVVGLSQNVENKILIWGEDSLDTELLNKLIEKEINKVRGENNLDTLIISNELRIGSLRNSTNCAIMPGVQLIHTEKDAFEVAEYTMDGDIGDKYILSNLAKSFVSGWLLSPPHRKALLKKDLKYFGCGVIVKYKSTKKDIYVCDRQNHGNSIIKTIDFKRHFIWASVRFKS